MRSFFSLFICLLVIVTSLQAEEAPDYQREIAPIFNKYCVSCHGGDDTEAKFALNEYRLLMQGGKSGAAITPGRGETSRLWRLAARKAEPFMPPDDQPGPSPAELETIKRWIDAGAKGPTGTAPEEFELRTPKIAVTQAARPAINAVAVSSDGKIIAAARFGRVDLFGADGKALIRSIENLIGNVQSVAFSHDDALLVVASGEPGLFGEARIYRVSDGSLVKTFRGHKDALLSARLNREGTLLATGSYDHNAMLWDVASGKSLHTLVGHNGAVFETAFHPSRPLLATASGDRTVKLWKLDGSRLDTLKESTKELYALAFHPAGEMLAAGGVDNRIRTWKISPDAREGTNPLIASVFAHEQAILRLAYSSDGKVLVSSGEDSLVKTWGGQDLAPLATLPKQADWPTALAVAADGKRAIVGRLDGSLDSLSLGGPAGNDSLAVKPLAEFPPEIDYGPQPKIEELPKIAEVEPNDDIAQATPLTLPGTAEGKIFAASGSDRDHYRIAAKKGEQWILETNAARSGAPMDTKLAVLDLEGRPVPRMLLRAVRDTEVEFRGASSEQRGFRVKNWEEMYLNEYVYLKGDIIKLHLQRRGPDADGQFYPENGNRMAFFDTTPVAHALAEPGYMVVPYALGTVFPDNGLPVFTLPFENDDESTRSLGRDSRLTFTAPHDGEFLIRVTDVRGASSEKANYKLIARRPVASFKVTLGGANPSVGLASGKQFTIKAERIDHFAGPIRVEITDLPPGFGTTSPIEIAAGMYEAQGVIFASPFAPEPPENHTVKATAIGTAAGKEMRLPVNDLGKITLADRPKVTVHLERLDDVPYSSIRPAERAWKQLTSEKTTSEKGLSFKQREDGATLVAGENPETDVYTIETLLPAGKVRALRLETLGDPSLPAGAAGRGEKNGNFVITEFSAEIAPSEKPEEKRKLAFASVAADYFQGGHAAANLLDGKAETGWAVAINDEKAGYPVKRRLGDPAHAAAFELAEPLELTVPHRVTIVIRQESPVKKHTLGCFRLSYSEAVEPEKTYAFREIPEITIVAGGSTRCKLRAERFGFKGNIPFDLENLPHGIIVDDIGLSGILIRENELDRTIFLRAEPWVPEQTRLFHAVAKVEGNLVSLPMRIRVVRE